MLIETEILFTMENKIILEHFGYIHGVGEMSIIGKTCVRTGYYCKLRVIEGKGLQPFWEPGTSFVEDKFSMDGGEEL